MINREIYRDFQILGALRYHGLKNNFSVLFKDSKLRLVAVAIIMPAIGAGLFWGFYRSFIFLQTFMGVGEILIERLLYLLSLAIFLMLILSNAAISLQLHYKSREAKYFQSLPLSHSTSYWFFLLEGVFLSSWATLFLLLPVGLAYGLTHHLPWPSYLAFPLWGLGLAGLAALLGGWLAALIPQIIKTRSRQVICLLAAVVLIFSVRAGCRTRQKTSNQRVYLVNHLLKDTGPSLNPTLPSYWAAAGLLQACRGNWSRSFIFFGVLGINIIFFSQVLSLTAAAAYHQNWSLYQSRHHRPRRGNRLPFRRASLLFSPPSPSRSLLNKDIKIFLRQPSQWIQTAVLFGLLAIYIFNIKNMPMDIHQAFWKDLITVFNLGASSLILATLSTRFIFPSLSLEGNTFWILGLAPVRRATIFRVKFWSNLAGALVITESLMLLSSHILEISGGMTAVTCGAVFLTALVLVSLALGLGAIFPQFKEDNPARIESGFGGTLNLVLSLIYIVVMVGTVAGFPHLKLGYRYLAGGTILLLSGAGTYLSLKLGLNALQKLEF